MPPRWTTGRPEPPAAAVTPRDDDGGAFRSVFLALICGGGVRRAEVACGDGELGGGVRLFSVMSDGTLRGEMKRYVKNMSGHKFAELGGGDVLQI